MDKIRRKIQKALALASNNPSEAEAQAALLKAQRLMLIHNVSEHELSEGEATKEIAEAIASPVKKLYWYEKQLAQIIANNFRCYLYLRGCGHSNSIIFLGLSKDTKIACDVYNYALSFMNDLCGQFIKEYGLTNNKGARKDYRLGFLNGLNKQLNQQVQEYGLILVKDPELIKEHDSMEFNEQKSRTPTNFETMLHYMKGLKDSENFDYERKQINEPQNASSGI